MDVKIIDTEKASICSHEMRLCVQNLLKNSRLEIYPLNSAQVLVGEFSACIQHLPCLVSSWCMLGVGVGGSIEEHSILEFCGPNTFIRPLGMLK